VPRRGCDHTICECNETFAVATSRLVIELRTVQGATTVSGTRQGQWMVVGSAALCGCIPTLVLSEYGTSIRVYPIQMDSNSRG
jgi:hypothetical protein